MSNICIRLIESISSVKCIAVCIILCRKELGLSHGTQHNQMKEITSIVLLCLKSKKKLCDFPYLAQGSEIFKV